MKYVLDGIVVALSLALITGCAELKQLRIETADQKARINQLTQEADTCRGDLNDARSQLLQAKNEALEKDDQLREQKVAFARMQEEMQEELDARQDELDELKGSLTLTMVESIMFEPGKAEVRKEGIEVLQRVAQVLKNTRDKEILVAGYTDNAKIRGKLSRKFPTNWELSMARAITVMKILEAQGIDPKLMSAVGYGEYHPVADNSTPEGRARNRRMEIILMPRRR
ncbi:MAG TPA: OmpA family protein [Deltaproteobacteria bacterium]|nr:OmpA family protein [Deltaproteobacteria bacterium]HOI07682.1 OmpA family protein [Deltaproteobacteria bacterium]